MNPHGISSDSEPTRMPAIFIAHGSPFTLDDPAWMHEWRMWARSIPRPKSILVISAHWEESPITLGATETMPLYYDFYGFPAKYYKVTYPAPGAPSLANRVRQLLENSQPVAQDESRGLDHGAFVPLIAMYPKADIPVLQMSLPTMDANTLLEVGRTLAPLRDEGVLIIGSGFLIHNMRMIDWHANAPVPWAKEFDDWIAEVLIRQKMDALVEYKAIAPNVKTVLPTHEHFVPVLVAQGTDLDEPSPITFPVEGFVYGSFTKRSVQFG